MATNVSPLDGSTLLKTLVSGSTPGYNRNTYSGWGAIGSSIWRSDTLSQGFGSTLRSTLVSGSTPGSNRNRHSRWAAIGFPISRPNTFSRDFDRTPVKNIQKSLQQLSRPGVSKFAKLFPASDGHSDGHRNARPRHYPHGDMSNLRPDDRGMDTATCIKIYHTHHMPTTIENQKQFIATDFDGINASISRDETVDLGALFAVRSTEEQMANCRARAHQEVTEEASPIYGDRQQTTSVQELDDAAIGPHSSSDLIDSTEATAEEITTSEDPETNSEDPEMEEEEEE